MTRLGCLVWGLMLWLFTGVAYAGAVCGPEIVAIQAAPETALSQTATASANPTPPVNGWVDVALPNNWPTRSAEPQASVWYRIDWQLRCAASRPAQYQAPEAVALGIDGMSIAGEVYSNDTLVWRDLSMVEPLSRSWNVPRWWVLPADSLQAGINSVWVRVVGVPELFVGLGALRMGSIADVQAMQEQRWWRQRTVYMLALGMSVAVGGMFIVVWLLRRREQGLGWYGFASLSWAAYLATLLATSSQPWHDALGMSRLNIALFAVYIASFCMFMWRFGGQHFPRIERLMWWLVVAAVVIVLLSPRANVPVTFAVVWYGFGLLFMLNCLQFQWCVWRPQAQARNYYTMCLALCWLLLLGVAVHDTWMVFQGQPMHSAMNPIVAPIATLLMALLLGGRLAQGMHRIEQFNVELEQRVTVARADLAQALSKSHAQALDNAKLQERVQIAHDLHDGLGATLVRGLALVEQAPALVPKDRMLSMLKIMRDDLRQVIDHGASSATMVPESPLQWIAPVRHRFMRILDELHVITRWRTAPEWPGNSRPTALQCMGLTRLLEEALSNVIKHSRAKHVRVSVLIEENEHKQATMSLNIEDDGIGFDVEAVQRAGLTVGFKSMSARADRIGATFYVESGPSGTSVCVVLPMMPALEAVAESVPVKSTGRLQPDPLAPAWPQPSVVHSERGIGA